MHQRQILRLTESSESLSTPAAIISFVESPSATAADSEMPASAAELAS